MAMSSISLDAGAPPRAGMLAGDRSAFARRILLVLVVCLLFTAVFSLASGATDTSALLVAWALLSGQDSLITAVERVVILDIRMPRLLLGMMIGASLAVSGATMQGLFRNPLADPGIVGVSAGAGLGAVTFIVLGAGVLSPVAVLLGLYHVPFAAFAGGLVFTFALYRISTRNGRTSVATMLLAGIALGAMAGAFTGLLVFWADDQQLRDLTFWGLGSVAGATWPKVLAVAPIIVPILLLSPFMARGLNAMTLGEATAQHLGVNVQIFKRVAIVQVAAATGASVAVSGGIGFVGIVVPHLLRLLIGPDHRYLLPACALLGAIMLLFADAIARQIVAPAELPIGIITATIGAPFFLWILLRRRGLMDI
ncbi:iron ABC transporter permease [Hoeflea sp. YIM 152468]|uniref:FecCD family ABC transporter permease n=1 Tax=Hoeflea sp. YIM 152468 TaxID=3031759 RepID=UPI0023D9D733|nr:iron ABC transporter permease [Hoeflea sp. YIM 152468]MDF1609084.1 iron ABC transporter permease [Hoeflea sp. YIM 152468]